MTYIPQSSYGGVPSGWNQTAATGEVIAQSATDAGVPIHIKGITGQDPAGDWVLFEIDDANNVLRFDVESNGNTAVVLDATNGATLNVSDPGTGGALIVKDDKAGAHHVGVFFEGLTNAPGDAALDAGVFALWLDATNGAAKLMVKAKQADGTVKTASVALS